MINIIPGVAMLHQNLQLGELSVAFDKGRDLEVNFLLHSVIPLEHGEWYILDPPPLQYLR